MTLLDVNLPGNLVYYGFDVAVLAPLETEMLFALNAGAPLTVSYGDLAQAVWGKRAPSCWLRELAGTAARLRVKLAPWDFAILCQSRIGYRLIHDPVHSGSRFWRGDEEALLCQLHAEGAARDEIARRIPRHCRRAIRNKLVRLKRAGKMTGRPEIIGRAIMETRP